MDFSIEKNISKRTTYLENSSVKFSTDLEIVITYFGQRNIPILDLCKTRKLLQSVPQNTVYCKSNKSLGFIWINTEYVY